VQNVGRNLFCFILLGLIGCSHAPVAPKQKTRPEEPAPSVKVKIPPQRYRADLTFHPRVEVPAFTKDYPRLCFDEGHHNLAVKDGFYEPVLELLKSDGYQVIHTTKPFVESTLKDCDLVYSSAVLGDADYQNKKLAKRSAFSDEEIGALDHWVRKGGGLLLAADHRPMANAFEKLLIKFGMVGSIVNVRDPKNALEAFPEEGIFSIPETQMNSESPIVRGRKESERLKKVFFFYGEGLAAPAGSDLFLKFSPEAKIGGTEEDAAISAYDFPAAAVALKLGKGRLVVLGDGTFFTSKYDLDLEEPTGINRPGSDNVQMALNVFHWLSKLIN
jgi:hypothetical protein